MAFDQITLGQIAVAVAFIVALFTGITSIKKGLKTSIENMLDPKFKAIEKSQADILKKIEGIETSLKDVDIENCKNYLVTFLAEAERGELKNETEIQRFHEEYDHYINSGGNSYVKDKVEYLKKKGVLN